MPLFAHRATMAGLRRIHGYTRAELKGLGVAVEGVRTDGFLPLRQIRARE